jgi:malate/lactate dehydrogenase
VGRRCRKRSGSASTTTFAAPLITSSPGKGATYYGIRSAVAHIVDVLLHDQRAILAICARTAGVPDCQDVTLALPHLVGGEGALATIPLALDAAEREGRNDVP